MAKKLSINTITAGDIKRRHPRYLTCDTDRQYAQLANDIYDMMNEELTFMEERERRNASISLALYFEDLRSGTHQFETFTHLYKKMYGYYLPYYNTMDASDSSALLDAMRFMLWHSICAERAGRMVNPTNDGLAGMAVKLIGLWKTRKDQIEPNEDLADYLYAEETQQDVNQVKTVLVWLCQGSCLGRWFTNTDTNNDGRGLKKFFPTLDKDTLAYANECFTVFEQQTWPLSFDPRHIYAEMIRLDMNDTNDPMAETIEHIGYKPFGIYQVVDNDGKFVQLKDFLGETISVSVNGFMGNVRKLAQQNTHIAGSFLSLDGQWEVNGPSLWLKPSKKLYDNYLKEEQQKHHALHDYVGQYDDFIGRNNGERLYFFKDTQELMAWMKEGLGLDTSALAIHSSGPDQPQTVFFEDNGQFTMSPTARCIKHPANPYYNHAHAMENALLLVAHDACSPGMTLYLMEHDMVPDAMCNDIRGREHGRRLVQDNLEFLARCIRRDIVCNHVVRQRTDTLDPDDDGSVLSRYERKHPTDPTNPSTI